MTPCKKNRNDRVVKRIDVVSEDDLERLGLSYDFKIIGSLMTVELSLNSRRRWFSVLIRSFCLSYKNFFTPCRVSPEKITKCTGYIKLITSNRL